MEGDFLTDGREKVLGVLERMEEVWLEKALKGAALASQLLLEIERQRAALLGAGGGGRVSVAAGRRGRRPGRWVR